VLAADEVLIVEGEKDCDRLRSIGFTATTSPEGAGKWQESFAEVLAGKRVVMIPDNDPVGRAHAEAIADSLHGKAASVGVLDLKVPKNGGDVSDWLDAGHTPDELRDLIAKAPEWGIVEGEQPEPARADIRLTPEHWNRMLADCAGTLRNVLYMRGTMPVMLARAVETGGEEIEDRDGTGIDLNGVRHRPGALLFMDAVPGRVAWYLDEHATFWRYVRREKEWVAQHCPKEVAASLVDAAIYLGFKPCAGIVHVPFLANGRLITTPGYHEPTGLILDLKGKLPAVPPRRRTKRRRKRLWSGF
jgi:hypothetical protein